MQKHGQAKRSCPFSRLGGSLSSSDSRDSRGTKTGFVMLKFPESIKWGVMRRYRAFGNTAHCKKNYADQQLSDCLKPLEYKWVMQIPI